MKIRSLLPMAFAMLCMTSAMAQSKTVTTTSAGTLAGLLTDDEKASVKELTVSGPLNKTDFNFIMTMTALESLDIKATTIAEETLDGTTYPADELPKEALSKNATIKKFVLPASIVSIGENSASFCAIADFDFSACTKLKDIKTEAFYCNNWINSINLSGLEALETIAVNAFNTCSSEVTDLPINLSGCSALKEIDQSAFANIKSTTVSVNFSGCSSLSTIRNRAFLNDKITVIDLSECTSLETIYANSFMFAVAKNSTATTFKLPANLKTIEKDAFKNQNKMTSVSILAVTPPTLNTGGFYATDGAYNATLTVPAGSKAAYEANEEWKKFKEIVESDGSSVKEFEVTNLKVWASGDAVYVAGAEEGAAVNVYNLSGALVASGKVSNGGIALQVSAKGLYLVKIGDTTAKVRL